MKNLSKFKDKVNARNLLVQAMYEFSSATIQPKRLKNLLLKITFKTKVDYIFLKIFLDT